MRGSFGTISPCVSYKVKDVLFETDDLKNPVAPLNLPSTNTGVESVWLVFKVTSVNVWISYNEMSYSLTLPLVALYDPDSKAKSYTLARPISFPVAIPELIGSPICLWSLRLTTNVFPRPTSGEPFILFSLRVDPVL